MYTITFGHLHPCERYARPDNASHVRNRDYGSGYTYRLSGYLGLQNSQNNGPYTAYTLFFAALDTFGGPGTWALGELLAHGSLEIPCETRGAV